MNSHTCQAIIITCIDFRFQKYIDKWIKNNFRPGTFDRVAWAGGIKDLDAVMGQIDISRCLHHINSVYLINHEDCGAYGQSSTPQKHAEDLKKAENQIKNQYPDLAVATYYLHLDGTFEPIS